MAEGIVVIVLLAGIVALLSKQKMLGYALGASAFVSLAVLQISQQRPVGAIALIFAVGCLERIYTLQKTTRRK